MDIRSEKLLAYPETSVSSIDGRVAQVQVTAESAFLGTMVEFMHKLNNRILTASTSVALGGSANAVAVGTSGMGSLSAMSGIYGTIQGWPFFVTGEALSAQMASWVSATTSLTIRKVLVCLTASALPVASSLAGTGVSIQLVQGSAYAVSYSGAASTGGASAWFNKVPLPKPSAHQVVVGWINVPNDWTVSATVSTPMCITDYRETQGFNFSALMLSVVQP
jgi:hypothetical protein